MARKPGNHAKRPLYKNGEKWCTTEFVKRIHERTGVSEATITKVLRGFTAVVGDALIEHATVQFKGYFSIVYRLVAEHRYADVNTGEIRIRPAYYIPYAEMGSKLKRYYKTFGEDGQGISEWTIIKKMDTMEREEEFPEDMDMD